MELNFYRGKDAEYYLMGKFGELGFSKIANVNKNLFDILLDDKIKIEVKSSFITHVRNKNGKRRLGTFRFSIEQINSFIDSDIWICFIIKHNKDYLILGFIESKMLNLSSDFLTLSQIAEYPLLSLDEWIYEVSYEK